MNILQIRADKYLYNIIIYIINNSCFTVFWNIMLFEMFKKIKFFTYIIEVNWFIKICNAIYVNFEARIIYVALKYDVNKKCSNVSI